LHVIVILFDTSIGICNSINYVFLDTKNRRQRLKILQEKMQMRKEVSFKDEIYEEMRKKKNRERERERERVVIA